MLAGTLGGSPAAAVGVAQPAVVSVKPAAGTPQVMDGSVNAIVQVGSRMVAAGTFTTVRQTLTSPDIVRNGIFAFDAATGAIDPTFDPNLGGAANSLDTDGTYVYVGGTFTSVSGQVTTKRVAKLTATGTLVPGLKAPNNAVTEVVARGGRLFVGGNFTAVGSTPRSALAAFDTASGALLSSVDVPFAGQFNGGATYIRRFDISPDGTKLVAIGNFATVGGAAHQQIVMLDIPAGAPATVASWNTDRFDAAHNPSCAKVFDTFTRDLDFAPDGSYFVVSATGAFAGGAGSGTLCDTTTRWETASTGADPSWTDYTGGDTTYGVSVTGTAVYVGGHMRWENNPYQGDQAGPGAVAREGIAALDPVNGLPLSWNPGRARGVGAQALYPTSTGLWVGSDTTRIGGVVRNRIAFLPLAGGKTLPSYPAPTLPGTLFGAQRPSAASTGVLYRVHAAGSAVRSADSGPDWTTDAGYVQGGSPAAWGSTLPTNATVPAGTPKGVFADERFGAMHWAFKVPAGKAVTLRLYFADQYVGTSLPGQRVFDVRVDGALALNHFDIVQTAGHGIGTMVSVPVTSDGTVDVDFSAVVENPLINALEVIDPSVATGTPTPGVLVRRLVNASGSPTAAATTADSSLDWTSVRGAFLVGSTLYYGMADGGLHARAFTASSGAVGPDRNVDLHDDPNDGSRIPFRIADLTGAFYDDATHRIYYTLFGSPDLYYRYFTPESEVVGALTFQASTGGIDLSQVSGMTYAGGKVLYGSAADGTLRSVGFTPAGLTGTPVAVSTDGSWTYNALFVPRS